MKLIDLQEVEFHLKWTILSVLRSGVLIEKRKTKEGEFNFKYWEALENFFYGCEAHKELKEKIHYYKSSIEKVEQFLNGEKYYELYDTDEIPSIHEELEYYFSEADDKLTEMSDHLRLYITKTNRVMIAMGEGFEKFFPGVKAHVKNEVGEMIVEPENMAFDRKMAAQLKAIEMEENVDGFLERMKTIESMIAEKADPLEILKLLQ